VNTLSPFLHIFVLFTLFSVPCFGQIGGVTQTITPEGGRIEIEPCGYVEFPAGFLIAEAEITFSCNDDYPETYTDNFEQVDAANVFAPIALNTLITIPASAIDKTAIAVEGTKLLKVRVIPTVNYPLNTMVELRYNLGNNTELFGFQNYDASKPQEDGLAASQVVPIQLSELALMVKSYNPQTITISILPVALRSILEDPGQDNKR
jgi:hypothetical protein